MTSLVVGRKFDAIEYLKKLRQANFTQDQAETIVQETELVIETLTEKAHAFIENKDLATKGDLEKLKLSQKNDLERLKLELQKQIAEASTKTIIWVAGLLVASGFIQHFFK